MNPRPRPAAAAGVDFEAVRDIALALPGAEAATSYGTPSIKVKGKFLLRLKEDGTTIALRVGSMEEREFLLRADPAVFFITDHYRDHPAVLIRLAAVTRPALTEVIEQAWRHLAPRRGGARPATGRAGARRRR